MSYETSITPQQVQKQSTMKELSSNIAFSGVITGGFSAIPSVVRNRGIGKAIKATKANNQILREYGKQQTCDVFTKNLKTAQNYEQYSTLVKTAQKLEKKSKKFEKLMQNGKLPLGEKIKNIFRKNPLSADDFKNITKANTQEALDNLSKAKTALKNGDDIANAAKAIANNKGIAQNAKTLFKHELSNKFVIFITALSAIPRITNEIIPAFKNEGVISGIKTTAKVFTRTMADFFSNAGFSAIGRTIGTVAGSVFGPVGTVIGGSIGDIAGSFFSNKLMCKIFKKDNAAEQANLENPQTAQQENLQQADAQQNAQQSMQQAAAQQTSTINAQTQAQNETKTENNSTNKVNYKPNRYEGMTSRYQGPRKTRKEFLA